MRVALKVAYDGGAFFGHQRQPDRRTVEGECLAALRAAKILRDPRESFFRSASRTDRGVSAIGNVIAFNTSFTPQAVVGAFNDRARDVWGWAIAEVPDTFHPRHALERWYRYHALTGLPLQTLRRAAALFVGEHDFNSFTSDPAPGPLRINRIGVSRAGRAILIDIRGRSFRRGMVRRVVSAMERYAKGEIVEEEIRAALNGSHLDFGLVRPEPLFLMDVLYSVPMRVILVPKVRGILRSLEDATELRARFLATVRAAVGAAP